MTMPALRGLRGATTCDEDTPEAIAEAVTELMPQLMARNDLSHDDVVSVIFTTSPDLTSAFPATAARSIGFGDIPLLCASEIDVPGSMRKCVRVLMHVMTTRERARMHHVYLRNAQSLRDDLPE
jgi:chorismate mutase